MARPRKSDALLADGASAEAALREAALACFVAQGYHGTSMRDIAARARLAVSASYYYFPSKADLLRRIMLQVTTDLSAVLRQADLAAGADPVARFAAVVRAHVLFHSHRQAESFVGNSELRSLSPEARAEMVSLRDEVGGHFKRALTDGIAAGVFDCPSPPAAILAIVTMCTAVATWFRADGPASPEQVADRYVQLALRMAGAKETR